MANTHSIDIELSSSQYLYAANSVTLAISGDLTIELWIKLESQPVNGGADRMALVAKDDDNANLKFSYLFAYQNTTGTPRLEFACSSNGNSGVAVTVNKTLDNDTWYHLAVVYTASGGTADFYVDGVQVGTQQSGLPTSIDTNASSFTIGAVRRLGSPTPTSSYYDGKIDDVRVWAEARSSSEISTNMSTELVGNEANLNAYYKLNNSLLDETANNNDLGNQNSAVFTTDIPFPLASSFTPQTIII